MNSAAKRVWRSTPIRIVRGAIIGGTLMFFAAFVAPDSIPLIDVLSLAVGVVGGAWFGWKDEL